MRHKILLFVVFLAGFSCHTPDVTQPTSEIPTATNEVTSQHTDCVSLKHHLTQKCCAGKDKPCMDCQNKAQQHLKNYRKNCSTSLPDAESVAQPKDPFADLDQASCEQLKVAAGKTCCLAMIDSCQRCSDKVKYAQSLVAKKCIK